MRSIRLLCVLLCGCPITVFPLQAPPAAEASPQFTVNARTVVEEVVVTNKNGQAVPGLHKEDFQIFENGKPQSITFFESNDAAQKAEDASSAVLPPDTFTNISAVPPNDVTNVLLLDSLNTRSTERMYAQVQMVKYLASLPPNLRVGVFMLTDKVHMLWGFNHDSSALRDAIARFASKRPLSSQLSKAAQKQAMIAAVAQVEQTAKRTNNARLRESADALHDFLKNGTHVFDLDPHDHPLQTMDALQTLAHYLAGIPGRKNLFWIVDDFPTCNGCFYADLFEETKDMLAGAGVSVYPIDANGVDANINPLAPVRFIDSETWAEDTGGKAYHENNIQQELADAVNHGSHYYTIAYVPSDHKEEGRERKVQIKVLSADYKVFYRKRYFEQTKKENAMAGLGPTRSPLLSMMGRGMPNFSEFPYRLLVTPAGASAKMGTPPVGKEGRPSTKLMRYRVAFQVRTDALSLVEDAHGVRRTSLEVILLVYNQDGQPLNSESHTITVLIRPRQWASALTQGISFDFKIDAPAGDNYLRTGIYDASQGKVGTLEIPLSAVGPA